MFEWDEAKRQANLAKHGVDFALIYEMDFESAMTRPDPRFAERRFQAIGRINGVAYFVGYTLRGERVRIITMRRAHDREVRRFR